MATDTSFLELFPEGVTVPAPDPPGVDFRRLEFDTVLLGETFAGGLASDEGATYRLVEGVPEPSTYAAILGALAFGFGFVAWRRWTRAAGLS